MEVLLGQSHFQMVHFPVSHVWLPQGMSCLVILFEFSGDTSDFLFHDSGLSSDSEPKVNHHQIRPKNGMMNLLRKRNTNILGKLDYPKQLLQFHPKSAMFFRQSSPNGLSFRLRFRRWGRPRNLGMGHPWSRLDLKLSTSKSHKKVIYIYIHIYI